MTQIRRKVNGPVALKGYAPAASGHSESMDTINYEWHSTPQLWVAVRDGYCGCNDCAGKVPMGFGKTKEDAAANLIEQEDG